MSKQWILNGVEYRVGNVVRVMRQVEDYDPNGMGDGMEWDNTWIASDGEDLGMDEYLGLSFEIAEISEEGVFFEGADACSYAFPLASLDKIAEALIERKAA
jgi:hypothetical protein